MYALPPYRWSPETVPFSFLPAHFRSICHRPRTHKNKISASYVFVFPDMRAFLQWTVADLFTPACDKFDGRRPELPRQAFLLFMGGTGSGPGLWGVYGLLFYFPRVWEGRFNMVKLGHPPHFCVHAIHRCSFQHNTRLYPNAGSNGVAHV